MKKGINLALSRKRVDNVLRKVFVLSVALFCISVIISIGMITYRLILKSSYDTLEAKEQQINSQLLQLQDKRDKLTETKSRIAEIKNVLAKRSPITTRIQTLSDVVPTDTTITSLTGDTSDMKITLEGESLSSINDLLEQRIAEIAKDSKKGISKVDMHSFGLNPRTSLYTVSFGVTFK